jgi:hypothetical protein
MSGKDDEEIDISDFYISEEPNLIPNENNMFTNNEARRNNINEYFSAK